MKTRIARLAVAGIFGLLTMGGARAEATMRDFAVVDSRMGLSQNNVKAIAQDDYGFIWLGTKNGLCRYDGRKIRRVWVADKEKGYANQNISALLAEEGHLLWVGTDEGLFLYDTSLDTSSRIATRAQDGTWMKNWVGDIQRDKRGNIWVIVPTEGIYRMETAGRSGSKELAEAPIHHYPNFKDENEGHFDCMCITPRGDVWASGWGIGLWRLDTQNDRFEQLTEDRTGNALVGILTNTLTCLPDGTLVMAVQNGHLMTYSPSKGELAENPWQDFSKTVVRGATAYDDQLLVGTYNGLYLIDTMKGEVEHYVHDRSNPHSVSDDIIYTTFRDSEGGFWIGTMFGGAAYMPTRTQRMLTVIGADSEGRHLSTDRIREIATDGRGNLWICTEDGGINHIDLETRRITPDIGKVAQPNDNLTLCLTYHREKLFASINKTGVKVIDTETGRTEMLGNAQLGLPKETSVYDILPDNKGSLWMATDHGAWRGNENLVRPLKRIDAADDQWIYDIMIDHKGNVWMALMGGGAIRMDAQGNVLGRYKHKNGDARSLSSSSVSALFEDSKGNVWLSTDRGGICRYCPESDDFDCISIAQGLPDDVAYDILEDTHGNLWFGTNQGLVKLNPETGQTRLFTTNQGLPSNQFNYKSALSMPDGSMFFGTINGLVFCQPNKVMGAPTTTSGQTPQLVFTSLRINGEEMRPYAKGSPLQRSIMETDKITLPYRRTNINLDVALLAYGSDRETIYEYRLEPMETEWHPVPDGGISLASLAWGNYTLRLRSSNVARDNATIAERTLEITVRKPLWQQWWALLLYLVGIGILVMLWSRWYRNRKEMQLKEQQRLFSAEKEKELNEKRIQYFTEIAHEIRTPLTLINGPLEVIQKMGIKDEKLVRHLGVIHQNTNRLLNLATQLLDFQKVGMKEIKPQLETVNVSELLRDTIERFEPTFSVQGKTLVGKDIETAVRALIDREAVTKILSNLLNNAMKYGNTRCEVNLTTDKNNLKLTVFSDGTPIPADKREAIFDPFVQLKDDQVPVEPNSGVGIGLALCRSLAKMLGGTLTVEMQDDGNCFVLGLPLGEVNIADDAPNAPANNTLADSTLEEEGLLTQNNVCGANILLVEDDAAICDFAAERLREDFIVETARNGQEAFDVLQNNHIDLVITDIMMPVMDGMELCRKIKENVELSHIPIILLTAKNDIETKIAGLKVGAEAFVEKPFAWDYLRQQIISLLSNRHKEREAFAKRPFFPMNNMQMSRGDEEFMTKIMDTINSHISDENFNVEAMADALAMSRSSLLRKIKTLFDMPPLDFIRLIRLKKAAELIQDGLYRMGEISEMVGFSNHSYFSKLFFKQFGMTPKDFEKQMEEQRAKKRTIPSSGKNPLKNTP